MEVLGNELLALNDLLTGCQDALEDYEEMACYQLIPQVLIRPIGQIRQVDPKAIWSMDEVPSDDEDDDICETRSRPQFEILYKQSVMTEDVFLGLSDKDPSSSHCEAMVVRVECPGHQLDDIELDVKRQKLLLLSSTLYAPLHQLVYGGNSFCTCHTPCATLKAKPNGTTRLKHSRSPSQSSETNGEHPKQLQLQNHNVAMSAPNVAMSAPNVAMSAPNVAMPFNRNVIHALHLFLHGTVLFAPVTHFQLPWWVQLLTAFVAACMSLLSSPRLEAIRLIREQLRCTLCGNIFQDPQCLDCKHNFCRLCILLHLKQNHTQCPNCQLPTRPSEVTRNQFLESILAAWKGVEKELESLNGDPALHAQKITVQDTDRAFHRAASGTGAVEDSEDSHQEERQSARGRVGNHKWHIDTQEIRQELKLEQPYLPQNYGNRHGGSTAHWKKTSSSDLPDDYGASASGRKESHGHRRSSEREKSEKKPPIVSVDEASVTSEDTRIHREEVAFSSPQPNSLMATQEVESYLDRITKQREVLSQWERVHHGDDGASASLLELERSLHNSSGFNELLQERRRESLQHDVDGDMLTQMTQMTQMPTSTSILESPDLLASFRRRSHSRNSDNYDDRRSGLKAKRRVLMTSHGKRKLLSPSRKRLRMPSVQDDYRGMNGQSAASAIDLSQNDSNEDEDAVPVSRNAIVLSNDDDDEEKEDKLSSDEEEDEEEEEEKEEEEYEMKPAVPLPPTPELRSPPPTQHCERLRNLFTVKKECVSDDFRSAITAFQSEANGSDVDCQSKANRQPASSTHRVIPGITAGATRASASGVSSKPPMHTSNGGTRAAVTSGGTGFVFVSSDLNREEVKRVLEATQQLGGKFGHDFDLKHDPVSGHFCTSVTHLITKTVPPIGAINIVDVDEFRCKRTAKYMRALAEGTYVMDFTWVTASLAAGRWLTEEPFEMIGDIYSDAVGKPREGRIRRVQTGRRNSIFKMFSFVLLVSEKEFDFQFASVRTLVNNFGGTVVQADNFAKLNSKQRSRRTPIGVVSKTTSPWEAKSKWHKFQIPIVRITWIFDSVSHLEVLPFDDYYPY